MGRFDQIFNEENGANVNENANSLSTHLDFACSIGDFSKYSKILNQIVRRQKIKTGLPLIIPLEI